MIFHFLDVLSKIKIFNKLLNFNFIHIFNHKSVVDFSIQYKEKFDLDNSK